MIEFAADRLNGRKSIGKRRFFASRLCKNVVHKKIVAAFSLGNSDEFVKIAFLLVSESAVFQQQEAKNSGSTGVGAYVPAGANRTFGDHPGESF